MTSHDDHTGQVPAVRGPWIETASGGQLYLLDPLPGDIHIEDIAAALSKQCRYNGHVKQFYSVAEHCVLMAEYFLYLGAPDDVVFAALMHDAAEAYVGDLPKPLKNILPEFEVIEDRIMAVIATRFGIINPMPSAVKTADSAILHTERTALMDDSGHDWGLPADVAPLDVRIAGYSPDRAHHEFMRMFRHLRRKMS